MTEKTLVLVIDDEKPIRRFLRTSLGAFGYEVIEAGTVQEGIHKVVESRPNLIILDLGLPDMDGVEATRLIREWTKVPIIILSVRSREEDKIAALDAGADDYLTKPFGVGELSARMRASLRHASSVVQEPVYQFNELTVDLSRHLVTLKNKEVNLTPTEYDILRLLAANAGRVITHRQILKEVWGTAYQEENHLLRVNISNLRHKIEPDPTRPEYILTESGVGYRLKIGD